MKKVLITGIQGFTGKHLAQALQQRGYAVVGITNKKSHDSNTITCNLTDKKSLFKVIQEISPDYVVHLAGLSFVMHEDHEEIYKVNLLGALNLLEALSKLKVKPEKIILASSANIYGNPNVEIIDETVLPAPVNHYAVSKLSMEQMARMWFDQLPIIITRPFNYTGIGQPEHFLIPKIVAHFKQKKTTINLGNIDVIRDISDVDFVVECYCRLLESQAHSDVFNVCSGIGYSIQDILNTMMDIAEYEIHIDQDPSLMRGNELKKLIGSNKKLSNTIGIVENRPISKIITAMYNH